MTDAKHEAPAEGAGEVDEDWIRGLIGEAVHMKADDIDGDSEELCRISEAVLDAIRPYLRARSSAPEAREGSPFMFAYEDVDKPGEWRAFRHQIKRADGSICPGRPLYTHPAAPSADKLREVVEGFVSDLTGGHPKARASRLVISHDALSKRIDQALAALKAEGA